MREVPEQAKYNALEQSRSRWSLRSYVPVESEATLRHLDLSRLFDVDEFLKDEKIRSEKDFRLLGRVSSFVPVRKHKLIGLSGKFSFLQSV